MEGLKVAASMITRHLRDEGYRHSESQILRRLRKIELERRVPTSGLVPRKLYDRDTWWKSLLKDLHLTRLQGSWIHKVTLRYWKAYQKSSPTFNDSEATVKRLKKQGYRLAMVSDSDGTPGMKRRRIEAVPFRSLFETAVVAGEDTPKVKPSRAPFLLVAKRIGVPARNCVYIGDNPETDVEGAKAVGMATILVRRRSYAVPVKGKDPPLTSPTFRVLSLRQIPAILAANKPRG